MVLPPRLAVIALVVAAGACEREGVASPPTPRPPPRTSSSSSGTCSVAGVAGAHPLALLAIPRGCTFLNAGSPAAPRVFHTAAELGNTLECTGVATPTFDLATHDLYVVESAMSPAFGGGETLDDGTTVTFVTRFRSPCPGDPQPMAMGHTLAFLLPKNATRTFRQANCTLPQHCP